MAYPPPGTSAGPSQSFSQAAYANLSSSSSSNGAHGGFNATRPFDVFEWYPNYQSCQRYFLDLAQHQDAVKAVAAFINIALPCQRHPDPIMSYAGGARFGGGHHPGPSWSSMTSTPWAGGSGSATASTSTPHWVSLVPYIRRLIVTGIDLPTILHGFFGDDWRKGVGELHEQERRNYLFAAKSEGWASVKKGYDGPDPNQTVPFLKPLRDPLDVEIEGAEKTWSEWLAMEDWMIGPRAPEHLEDPSSSGRGQQRPR